MCIGRETNFYTKKILFLNFFCQIQVRKYRVGLKHTEKAHMWHQRTLRKFLWWREQAKLFPVFFIILSSAEFGVRQTSSLATSHDYVSHELLTDIIVLVCLSFPKYTMWKTTAISLSHLRIKSRNKSYQFRKTHFAYGMWWTSAQHTLEGWLICYLLVVILLFSPIAFLYFWKCVNLS